MINIEVISVSTPLDRSILRRLRAGDRVNLTGEILVFRDEVHQILCGMIEKGETLPFSLKDTALYYCGPTPASKGRPVGSAGPTTSSRMDRFTGPLLEQGLAMTIGKGGRSPETAAHLIRHQAVYMAATGGVGALLAKHITFSEIIAFPELGPEAARIFTVRDFPLITAIDTMGNTIYSSGTGAC
jgi:fumarate hydratase subunit beta